VSERLDRLVRDPDLRTRLGEAGHAQVSAVSWEEQLERAWGAMTKRGEPFT
jgi:hypothetical protein